MRTFLPLALVLSAGAAHAAPGHLTDAVLHIDEGVWEDAATLISLERAASSSLPATLEFMDQMAAAKSSGSSGGGPGVLSGVGIGLQIGTPTALTFKFAAGGNANIVLGIGAGIGYLHFGQFGLSLHGDYLFTLATLVNNGTVDLTAYLGPGLWITLFNASDYVVFGGYVFAGGYNLIGIGARLPLGLNLRFDAAPIEIYLELDPALFVFPAIGGFIGASLGFRWFF